MSRRTLSTKLRTGVAIAAATTALFAAGGSAATASETNGSSASDEVSATGLNLGFKVFNNTGMLLKLDEAASGKDGWGNKKPAAIINDVSPGYFELDRPAKDHGDITVQNTVTYNIVNPATNAIEGQVTFKPNVTFSHNYFKGRITVTPGNEKSDCVMSQDATAKCSVTKRMSKQKEQTEFSVTRG